MVRSELGHSGLYSDYTIDDAVAEKAALTAMSLVDNVEDGILFLDMLGLIPPQPGNEPLTRAEAKRIALTDQRRAARARKKAKKLADEQGIESKKWISAKTQRLLDMGVDPRDRKSVV